MKTRNFLAMDFGASSGRGMLGHFDGDKLIIEELHRFPNFFVDVSGIFYWDILKMYHNILVSLQKAREKTGKSLNGLGIDTWGTDYGLLDTNGQLISNCRCMRNADSHVSQKVDKIIPFKELFLKTGIQTIYGNTIFQLYERILQKDPALLNAEKMLMLPDLLAYFLTGQKCTEYTMATTTMLYNPLIKGWDEEIIKQLGLPDWIFSDVIMPGKLSYEIRTSLLKQVGLDSSTKYIPVGTHDTASAVAAAPLQERQAFCSSGTWSLFGVESDIPVLTDEAFDMNLSNEGTVDGKIRLIKNIMGMWIIQQCQEEWARQKHRVNWDEIIESANQVPPHQYFIDLENPVFYNAGDMVKKVQGYCKNTNQPIPQTIGEISRCVFESIVFRYRLTLEQLEIVTGKKINALRIVGGGGQNRLLNQFSANAMGIPVLAGPVESACAGNILVQAMACGDLASVEDIREIVKRSFPTVQYDPIDTDVWADAYSKYCKIINRS